MARKVKVEDPEELRDLVAANVESLEAGLTILESGLRLGAATIDLIALDVTGSLVLISVGGASHETLLALVDAYLWCIVNPENLRRLYPDAVDATTRPPRIIVIAERFPESFVNAAGQLSVAKIEAFEFQHFEVKGQSVLCFEAVALRVEPEVVRDDEPEVVPDETPAVEAEAASEELEVVEQAPGEWDTFFSNLGVEPRSKTSAAPSPTQEAASAFAAKAPAAKPVPAAPAPVVPKPIPPAPKPVAPAAVAAAPVEAQSAAVPEATEPEPVAAKPAAIPTSPLAATPAAAKPVAARAARLTPPPNFNGAAHGIDGAVMNGTPPANGTSTNAVSKATPAAPPAPAQGNPARLLGSVLKGTLGSTVPGLKIVRTADEMAVKKPQPTPVKTEPVKVEAVKTEPAKTAPVKIEAAKMEPARTEPAQAQATEPADVAVPDSEAPANSTDATDARTVVPVPSGDENIVAAAPAHPALESLKFPKDGLSRQWLEFLNQLAAKK